MSLPKQLIIPQIDQLNLKASTGKKSVRSSRKFNQPYKVSITDINIQKEKQILRQKKKNYSEAIRQRNLKKKSGNNQSKSDSMDKDSICIDLSTKSKKVMGQNKQIANLSNISLIESKSRQNIKPNTTQKDHRSRNKYLQKDFMKRYKQVLIENQYLLPNCMGILETQSMNGSFVAKPPKTKPNQYKISSLVMCIQISPQNYQNQQLKNKENTIALMQGQLRNCKNYIEQLEKNIQQLLQSRNKVVESNNGQQINNFIVERLMALQEQVFTLKKIKNSLELKIHSTQRKIIEQTDIVRKKSAREIYMWKQKYNSIVEQNNKLKNNLELSFSMEISHDQ